MIRLKLLTLLTVFMSTAAFAQNDDGELQIAVLDMATALFNSNIANDVNQRVQSENANDLERIRNLESQAQELQQRLNVDAAVMSDSERQDIVEQLQELNVQYEYLIQKVEGVVQQRRQQFEQAYTPNLIEAITAVVEEEGYDIVFRAEVILHYRNAFDITSRVTERLNQQDLSLQQLDQLQQQQRQQQQQQQQLQLQQQQQQQLQLQQQLQQQQQ